MIYVRFIDSVFTDKPSHLLRFSFVFPALKSPAAFHEQRKSLERSKTGDYLKHKIRSRPEKSELVNMRILQEPAAEGPAHDSQTKLKRARLADNLNERIALRPGPLELVEKNIIPVHSTVKEAAMKGIGAKHTIDLCSLKGGGGGREWNQAVDSSHSLP
uniref:Phosphatase and actin regulator n=1 Tax=Sinocyclocheilus anshuiensis TaxID=1608454 RepID=A0A671R854_9TELE